MEAKPSGIPNIEESIANRTEHEKAIDSIIAKIVRGEEDVYRLLKEIDY